MPNKNRDRRRTHPGTMSHLSGFAYQAGRRAKDSLGPSFLRLCVRENSVAGKRHYSATSPSPHSATLQCVRKVQTVRQKQKFVGIVAIWNGFEVLICARIESDHHIEPLASGFLDVKSRHPAFDLRNSLFPRQRPMSSVRVNPANGMNTKCPGSVRRDDLAYAERSSHWCIPHEHDDGDGGLLGSGTTGMRVARR